MSRARRDENRIVAIIVESSDGDGTIIPLVADPVTSRLLVNSTISGSLSIAPLTTIYNGSKTVPTAMAEAIASSQAVSSVTVKALSTNTVAVYVGVSGVTTANGFELLAGESLSLDIDNLADVFVISGSASQVVRYIAI